MALDACSANSAIGCFSGSQVLQVVLLSLCIVSMVVTAWIASRQSFHLNSWIIVTGRWLALLLVLLNVGLYITNSENFNNLRHWVVFVFIMCLFSPYLRRPSRYHTDHSLGCTWTEKTKYRGLPDFLIVSSAVYALAGCYSIYCGEWHLGIMQMITWLGSSFYHVYREAQFFNLDNIFATSLLGTTAWSIMHAYSRGLVAYALLVLLGLPLAAFFLAYCGMPAEIRQDNATGKVLRLHRPEYDFYHTAWHFVSGFGCMFCTFYFSTFAPDRECGAGNFSFSWLSTVPIGPTMCLLFGMTANILGNVFGIMPLD